MLAVYLLISLLCLSVQAFETIFTGGSPYLLTSCLNDTDFNTASDYATMYKLPILCTFEQGTSSDNILKFPDRMAKKGDKSLNDWMFHTKEMFWSSWQPASRCLYCSPPNLHCKVAIPFAYDIDPTFITEYDAYAEDFKQSTDMLNLVKMEGETTCSWSYNDGPAQVFYSQMMMHGTAKGRHCTLPGGNGMCGDWIGHVEFIAPVQDVYKTACSIGYNNVHCRR